MMKYALGLLIIVVLTAGCADIPCHPGPPYNHEIAMSLTEMAGGEIVFAGVSIHKGTLMRGNPLDCSPIPPHPELFYSEVNAEGEWVWEQFVKVNVGSEGYDPYRAVGIKADDGGGITIAGVRYATDSGEVNHLLYRLNTDANGEVVSHLDSVADFAHIDVIDQVIARAGGGFAFVVNAYDTVWTQARALIVTDENLMVEFSVFPGIDVSASDLIELNDGGFALIWNNPYRSGNSGLIVFADDGTSVVSLSWNPSDFTAKAVVETEDGLAVAGQNGSSISVRHYASDGGFIREDRLVMDGLQYPSRMVSAANGDLVIVGVDMGYSRNQADTIFLRTSSSGELIWSVTNHYQHDEEMRDLIATSDGGFVAGGTINFNIGGDAYLLKVSGDGVILWDRVIGI